jgi:hypothetical protein
MVVAAGVGRGFTHAYMQRRTLPAYGRAWELAVHDTLFVLHADLPRIALAGPGVFKSFSSYKGACETVLTVCLRKWSVVHISSFRCKFIIKCEGDKR